MLHTGVQRWCIDAHHLAGRASVVLSVPCPMVWLAETFQVYLFSFRPKVIQESPTLNLSQKDPA